jgi:hypothetical protein
MVDQNKKAHGDRRTACFQGEQGEGTLGVFAFKSFVRVIERVIDDLFMQLLETVYADFKRVSIEPAPHFSGGSSYLS